MKKALTTEEIDTLPLDQLINEFFSIQEDVIVAYGDDGQPVGTKVIIKEEEEDVTVR